MRTLLLSFIVLFALPCQAETGFSEEFLKLVPPGLDQGCACSFVGEPYIHPEELASLSQSSPSIRLTRTYSGPIWRRGNKVAVLPEGSSAHYLWEGQTDNHVHVLHVVNQRADGTSRERAVFVVFEQDDQGQVSIRRIRDDLLGDSEIGDVHFEGNIVRIETGPSSASGQGIVERTIDLSQCSGMAISPDSTKIVDWPAAVSMALWHRLFDDAHKLIDAGANVNTVDLDGNTPLLIAAGMSDGEEIALHLLRHGADPAAANNEFDTPFFLGCGRNHVALVGALIEQGQAVNWLHPWGETALIRAAGSLKGEETALLLLGKGADPFFEDKGGSRAIEGAVWMGNARVVSALLDKGVKVNTRLEEGRTPLMHAPNAEIAELLIKRGADVQATDNEGAIALHLAAGGGLEAVVAVLIAHGCDINAVDNCGRTPLLAAAATCGGEHAALRLLKLGSDLDSIDHAGHSVLHYAVMQGHQELIAALLSRGLDVPRSLADGKDLVADIMAPPNGAQVLLQLIQHRASFCITEEVPSRALYWAVQKGDLPLVVSLLDLGASLNGRNSAGETPLHWACENGDRKMVAALLEMGAAIDERDNKGSTPLLEAAWSVQGEDAALCLLEHGADWTVIDSDRWGFGEENSVLHVSAARGHDALIAALLERGMDVDTYNNWNTTPLGTAIEHRREATAYLLLNAGADPSATVLDTPLLHLASLVRYCDLITALLDKGAPIDQRDENGSTALMYAVETGDNRDVVALLLARGADPLLVPDNGQTLLHTVRGGRVLDILLETPIDLNQEDHEGCTPLMRAASEPSFEGIAQRLLEAGADLSKKDREGRTALHHACRSGCLGLIEDLLSRGASVDERDNEGITPLMAALEFPLGDCEAAPLLCDKGANIHLADHRGRTPLFFAAGHEEGEELALRLLEAGVDPCPIDTQDGSSALHHASAWENCDLIAALLDQNVPIDLVDDRGRSPLWYATGSCWSSEAQGVNLNPAEKDEQIPLFRTVAGVTFGQAALHLLEAGANPLGTDKLGQAALHHVCQLDSDEYPLVEALLSHGASINMQDSEGMTPLMVAIKYSNWEVSSLLLCKGANIHLTDHQGLTALDYATRTQNQELIRQLQSAESRS